jgi:hypothetical protein
MINKGVNESKHGGRLDRETRKRNKKARNSFQVKTRLRILSSFFFLFSFSLFHFLIYPVSLKRSCVSTGPLSNIQATDWLADWSKKRKIEMKTEKPNWT